jgi:L-rhamnose mutarotase
VQGESIVKRVCFVLQIKQEHLEEYKERHAAIWPAMLEALQQAGWSNYSLFLRPDGLLVGYLETEDFNLAQQKMQMASVNTRWQQELAHCFEDLGETMPDQSMIPLAELFHLA